MENCEHNKLENSDFNINEKKIEDYAKHAKDWCIVNGLVCIHNDPGSISTHDLAYPLPVTLFPTKFPKKQFDYAKEIQVHLNDLVHNISNDHEFLEKTLKNVIKVDDFTRNLWEIYEKTRAEGVTQPISMSILRNDLMLDKNKCHTGICLSQIEINTVSVSFGASTTQMTKFHKNILNYTNNQKFIPNQIENDNLSFMAKGIVDAWKLYENPNAYIVFVISKNERNIGDQRLLENRCYDFESSLKIKRLSMDQIYENAKLDDKKILIYDDEFEIEIGLVYYRAGYAPTDYNSENDWSARLLVERSLAIKSPNIQQHLAGAKRIQQALCEPGVMQRFIKDQDIIDKLKVTFVPQYSFEKENFDKTVQIMLENSQNFVLKPQREGGGNNIYREDILKFYDELSDKSELQGYILMTIVDPFISQNYVIKTDKKMYEKEDLISELGVFGILITKSNEIISNTTGGYLIRTKPLAVNEGGVATGYAALDSLILF